MSGSVCELFVWGELGSPWTSEAGTAQHCHKNSPSWGRQVLPLAAFPSRPAWPAEGKRREPTARRIGTWPVRGLRGDAPVTKGGNEYAGSVIILYASQFVFSYVISIIKLPKQETKDTTSSQGVGGGKRGQGNPPPPSPITKLPSVGNSLVTARQPEAEAAVQVP